LSELKKELVRKSIHFSGLVYIPAYLYFGREVIIAGVTAAFIFALLFEFLRLRYNLLSFMVRDYEKSGLGAYFYFSLAILLISIIFPMEAAISAVIISLLGDGVSGIVKRTTIRHSKNIGSVLMFLISFTVSLQILHLFPSLFACIAATAVERVEKVGKIYLQDNLTVPLTAATVYHAVWNLMP